MRRRKLHILRLRASPKSQSFRCSSFPMQRRAFAWEPKTKESAPTEGSATRRAAPYIVAATYAHVASVCRLRLRGNVCPFCPVRYGTRQCGCVVVGYGSKADFLSGSGTLSLNKTKESAPGVQQPPSAAPFTSGDVSLNNTADRTFCPARFFQVIFSCLTLWSIMWRPASSERTSSGVMPSSAISTSA